MVTSGLSGNEMFCLNQLGYQPGDLLVGNSVYSMGFLRGVGSGFRGMVGGEIRQYTEMIEEGRKLSLARMEQERNQRGGIGLTGVTSELVFHSGNIEFLSVASAVHSANDSGQPFSSSSDGQELYCQIDAGYTPLKFVFGNVAYSIGLGMGLLGGLKSLARGEVKEYTQIFTTTRNLALERIIQDAKTAGANSVVGIETSIIPFGGIGIQEMLMIGTASHHPAVADTGVITSDLTCEELWNVTKMGYVPLRLLIGTSVYSLGLVGGLTAALKNLAKGEISELTTLIYDAREESLKKITDEAQSIGADDVLGIKTYVYSLGGGLIEFLAIGTAVKRVGSAIQTRSPQILPQAIIRDRDTFYNSAEVSFGLDLNAGKK
ncbi:heavy metal-binding domain-containing protein [Patescibacteria group bacterium]|nr:heavy metal-binding domain-containing protein [Patescibacteria group bacterium]